mgnify:CR=1 FL=1
MTFDTLKQIVLGWLATNKVALFINAAVFVAGVIVGAKLK